jgi:nucleoid-associated protein YgaU
MRGRFMSATQAAEKSSPVAEARGSRLLRNGVLALGALVAAGFAGGIGYAVMSGNGENVLRGNAETAGRVEGTSDRQINRAATPPTQALERASESDPNSIQSIAEEEAAIAALIAGSVVHEATPVTTGRSTGEWVLNGETRTECIRRANQVFLDYTRRGIRFDPSVYWCNWDFSDIEAAGGRRS